uniref:Uncharacterized protein n=1 Tax=uncultured prokaryote TaxID=198431 RepID=A0A0H5Q3F7_9ZZZZ|nr:hypothetical protein [uncultured prokaryote]
MAYPVITDVFRAQVIFQGVSGLPEDVYVNNLYFRNDDVVAPTGAIKRAVANYYSEANGASTNAVASYMNGGIGGAQVKIYDLGESGRRFPINPTDTTLDINFTSTDSILPEEVALVMSFRGGPGKRQRGRIYVGPFVNGVAQEANGLSRPRNELITAMGESGLNLMNTSENITWVVASPTGASSIEVTQVSVDNAFDTQRSRGTASNERRTWIGVGEQT